MGGNSVNKLQQTANLQALFLGQGANSASRVEPGRIQRSDGSTSSVVQQQAPKKSFGQMLATPFIWIGKAFKSLFTRNVRTEANPAAMPASQMSADEIKKGASVGKNDSIDKPARLLPSSVMQGLVFQSIGFGDRDKFNSAANIKDGTRMAYTHDQGSLIQSNPILKSVISEFTKLQMNSTQKEWNAIANNSASICSKAIEFAEKHQELSKISNPVVREFVNPNASAISLIMTLSDAHLQHNFFDRAGFVGNVADCTMYKAKSLVQEDLASLGNEELLAINEKFNKYPIFGILEGNLNEIGIRVDNLLDKMCESGDAINTAMGKTVDIGIMGTQIREITRDLLSDREIGFYVDAHTAKKEKIRNVEEQITNLQERGLTAQDSTELSTLLEEKVKVVREIDQIENIALEGVMGDFLDRTIVSGGDINRALDDILHNNKHIPVKQLAPSVNVPNPALFGVITAARE